MIMTDSNPANRKNNKIMITAKAITLKSNKKMMRSRKTIIKITLLKTISRLLQKTLMNNNKILMKIKIFNNLRERIKKKQKRKIHNHLPQIPSRKKKAIKRLRRKPPKMMINKANLMNKLKLEK